MMKGRRKVLCLHGLYQCANVMKAKSVGMQAAVTKANPSLELVYVDAPFLSLPPILQKRKKSKVKIDPKCFRAWYTKEASEGLREGAAHLYADVTAAHDLDDVDAVLGFSQGGAMAAFLASREGQSIFQGWQPKWVGILSGYEHADVTSPSYEDGLPSLHVWGSKDQIILPANSQLLAEQMASPWRKTLEINGHGHAIPGTNDSFCQVVEDFVRVQY